MVYDPHTVSDATLRLLLVKGLGPKTLHRLNEKLGSHEAIAGTPANRLADALSMKLGAAKALREAIDAADPAVERALMAEHGARLIVAGDDDYPVLLSQVDDAPAALWVRGSLSAEDSTSVAIVGSRQCTPYGREQAGRFAALLAQSGLTIVSGGAIGIDGETHRGALRAKGRTIAVLACGLATAYPPEHGPLFDQIVASGGAVVSEMPMATAPRATLFPRRNRIISGMSMGVLVIEAALRSGALITARIAAEEHGREVMALPGRVDSPASVGCNCALRDGWAALVIDHADVLRQLDGSGHRIRGIVGTAQGRGEKATMAPTLFDLKLSDGQQAIVGALKQEGASLLVDVIAARTQLPMHQIMADLTLLQIRGVVGKDRGGFHLRAERRPDVAG
jgi:DNA processing protein